jgi:hypothetical protein
VNREVVLYEFVQRFQTLRGVTDLLEVRPRVLDCCRIDPDFGVETRESLAAQDKRLRQAPPSTHIDVLHNQVLRTLVP